MGVLEIIQVLQGGGRKRLLERIAALETAVERLESGRRALTLEWESVYDKMNRIMGRLNARIRKQEASESPESDEQPAPKGVEHPMEMTGTHDLLQRARARHGLLPR